MPEQAEALAWVVSREGDPEGEMLADNLEQSNPTEAAWELLLNLTENLEHKRGAAYPPAGDANPPGPSAVA